ncbi:MAG: hypothetical protein LVT47_11320 [Cyanobacteria bacterium LVE1205-1]
MTLLSCSLHDSYFILQRRSVSSRLSSGVVSFADPYNDDRLVPVTSMPRGL